MAINGDGYFTVERPTSTDAGGQRSFAGSSPAYTRRGDFQLDANGYLVNGAGSYLTGTPAASSTGAPSGTPQLLQFNSATLPTGQGTLQNIAIGANGQVEGTFTSGQTVNLAGIPLSSFAGDEFMQSGDGGTFTPTPQSGAAQAASGKIVGSTLEASNTDITGQFTAMIMTQQAYGANTKVMTATNEMLQTLTNMTL
jgi:flagellar hook protein FlgE